MANDLPMPGPPVAPPPNAWGLAPGEWQFWRAMSWIAIPLLLCDLSMMPLASVAVRSGGPNTLLARLMFASFGVIAAQIALLGFAHVLGPGTLLRRTLIAWSWGLVSGAAWLAGCYFSTDDGSFNSSVWWNFLGLLCAVPCVAFANQSPLWLLRLTRNWRLSHPEHAGDSPNSLADFFGVTTFAAATFGLAQLGRRIGVVENQGDFYWTVLVILLLIAAGVGALVMLPLMLLVLRRRQLVPAVALAITLPCLACGALWVFLEFFQRQPSGPSATLALASFSFPLSGTLLAAFTWLAHRGWRLSTQR